MFSPVLTGDTKGADEERALRPFMPCAERRIC